MTTSSSSSSSTILDPYHLHDYPLATLKNKKEAKKKKDWVMIGAIIAAVVGGLIAGLAALCIQGYFPTALLGGPFGVGATAIVGLAILIPSGYLIYRQWKNPPPQPQPS